MPEFVRLRHFRMCGSIHLSLIASCLGCLAAEEGESQESTVTLDTKIAVKRLPPPPFKGLVKGEMHLRPVQYDFIVQLS